MLAEEALEKVVWISQGGTLVITITVLASGSLIWIDFYHSVNEKVLFMLQRHLYLICLRTADVSHIHTK